MKQSKKKIQADRWYSLSEMVEEHLFEWCVHIATYRRYIMSDRQSKNYLKAVIMGTGRQKIYRIKGENIIKYLAAVENGIYQI